MQPKGGQTASARRKECLRETLLIIFVGIPLVGILGGGVYSILIYYLTGEKEPWRSLLLTVAFGVTIFTVGYLCGGVPMRDLLTLWGLAAVIGNLIRLLMGWDNTLESFFPAHMLVLMAALCLGAMHAVAQRKASKPIPRAGLETVAQPR